MSRPILPKSPGEPWRHLQPVLEAEQDWGNSTRDGFVQSAHDGWWVALMRRPLHVEALRAEFAFPPGITVGTTAEDDTYVVDAVNQVRIAGYNAARLAGPPRTERTGLLRRLLGP